MIPTMTDSLTNERTNERTNDRSNDGATRADGIVPCERKFRAFSSSLVGLEQIDGPSTDLPRDRATLPLGLRAVASPTAGSFRENS